VTDVAKSTHESTAAVSSSRITTRMDPDTSTTKETHGDAHSEDDHKMYDTEAPDQQMDQDNYNNTEETNGTSCAVPATLDNHEVAPHGPQLEASAADQQVEPQDDAGETEAIHETPCAVAQPSASAAEENRVHAVRPGCVVKSLDDAFRWPSFVLQEYSRLHDIIDRSLDGLVKHFPDSDESTANRLGTDVSTLRSMRCLAERVGLTTMSTAYSGVDAPGTGVFQLIAGLEADYGVLASHPDHLRAIEINSHCQTELSVHPSTPQCIFGDLEDFLLPRLKRALPQMLEEGTVASELRPLMMSDPEKSVLLRLGWCKV